MVVIIRIARISVVIILMIVLTLRKSQLSCDVSNYDSGQDKPERINRESIRLIGLYMGCSQNYGPLLVVDHIMAPTV